MDNGKRESIIKEHIARTPYNETHIASRSQILRHIAKQTESGVSHYLSSIEMPVDGRTTPPPSSLPSDQQATKDPSLPKPDWVRALEDPETFVCFLRILAHRVESSRDG